MRRDALSDLPAFLMVAEQRSFTRAAAKLGVSPSALSHSMKALEDRLGLRLLARTTRSVRATEVGERLLRTLRPAFEEIGNELTALSGLRDKPAGTVRLTTFKHAATAVVWPVLPAFLDAHPDIRVEISIDDGLTDIVASRYDAGIRWGEKVDRDMIAVRVGPEVGLVTVGAPGYFAGRTLPKTPQDLASHRCINYRLTTAGGLYLWEYEKDGRQMQVRVDGPLVLNDGDLILAATLAGQGIGYLYDDLVAGHVAEGRLIRVLSDWAPPPSAYYLYYPSRRQLPPALAALVEALRTAVPPAGHARGSATARRRPG